VSEVIPAFRAAADVKPDVVPASRALFPLVQMTCPLVLMLTPGEHYRRPGHSGEHRGKYEDHIHPRPPKTSRNPPHVSPDFADLESSGVGVGNNLMNT
jgi:hypothetical protein